ncbi:unnamed protein product [Closterium sp. Yama58-4]|nr:unnamed protein product [Closterium sp. Yama58-4]
MNPPNNVPLPFLDFHCSAECAADCDGLHIRWTNSPGGPAPELQRPGALEAPQKSECAADCDGLHIIEWTHSPAPEVQRTRGTTAWDLLSESSNCAPVPLTTWTHGQTVISKYSLPVIPCTATGKPEESAISDLVPNGAVPVDGNKEGPQARSTDGMPSIPESELLHHVGSVTDFSMSSGGGHVSMLTQQSPIGQGFKPLMVAAATSAPVTTHPPILPVVNAPPAPPPPAPAAAQPLLAGHGFTKPLMETAASTPAPATTHPQIHPVVNGRDQAGDNVPGLERGSASHHVHSAHSAHPNRRDQAGVKVRGLLRPPIQRRSATEKHRRHRISAGLKRLEKAIPPSWMHQKHALTMSSRTDMASLLDAAVEFIRELEEQAVQLSQAHNQQASVRYGNYIR